ncbi:type II secretion system protein GspL [Shewanella eurypsychrophilus]|uniref:Type II secretion system protein L n=1 Tax=Shewanella eurypsychrophilus TaxID=2593656 RepID=A0ABX6VBQ5_9GAMM|nr:MULTISPECIES: type II secretion system protein GspL [Shewanella]QFU24926.1 type II secretion system protein GspL [Shewanella sp. YLB-09]QPG60108.1 type II secretion system protein GspL [Shewanella eurypsychrophilus]
MSERLFIRLGSSSEQPCSWLVWSELEQEIIGSGELKDAAALSSLTERAGNRPVDVLVPSSAITLTNVELPEKGQRQAIQALPFMLEENLAENVDDLHFVTGPRDGELLSVAVVAHEQMQTWLSWLSEAGLKVKRIVPDCLALPLEQCQWAAIKFNQEYLLRTGVGAGVSLSESWLNMALPKLLPTQAGTPVTVAAYSDLSLVGAEVQLQELELPMLVLAKGILSAPINLLTGAYLPKRDYGKHVQIWRNAAIVIAIALLLSLVNKGLNIHQMNSEKARLQQQSEAIFKQAVPGTSRIVNLRSQMDRHLRSMQGQGGGSEFFSMLEGLEEAFTQVPELKPTTLRFDSARNELRMQVIAKSYAQVERFKDIVSRSYQLDSGAMNSGENSVTSTLTLRIK